MKAQNTNNDRTAPAKKCVGKFATEAELLAEKSRRFQEVFGKVDWEQAKKDGLIS